MYNKIRISCLILALASVFAGCSKDNIMMYKQDATIYFSGGETKYTFVENQDKLSQGYDYVVIPVKVSGFALDKDRTFNIAEDKTDTLHTAEAGMIEFESGIIPANSYVGSVRVKINYKKVMDDSIYVSRVKMIPNDDFKTLNLNFGHYSISFGNIISIPENWSRLKTYFGNYSNSWYAFMLRTSGLPSFPYKYTTGAADKAPDAARWPMTIHEVQAHAAVVRDSLNKYNERNPLKNLKHEDGEFKDQLVKMGNF